jgi:hypothetical protein
MKRSRGIAFFVPIDLSPRFDARSLTSVASACHALTTLIGSPTYVPLPATRLPSRNKPANAAGVSGRLK